MSNGHRISRASSSYGFSLAVLWYAIACGTLRERLYADKFAT
ncbi:hypothetical protein [Nodularia sp. NIES-3585]|nr:hypothetical protein [Nodularia sp. NIES-3585]